MNVPKKHLILTLIALPIVFWSLPTLVFANEYGAMVNILWYLVNNFFGLFAGLAGMLLDSSINNFVIGFGDRFLTTGVGVAVDKLWVNIRDIFNISFIFGLVYIGFKMILGSDDSGTKRWLVHLIMAALLVNFSLYITKFIVDFTNILATQIVTGGFAKNATTGLVEVSTTLMANFGITTIFGGNGTTEMPTGLKDGAPYGYIFGAAILFIVATFVFASGAIMLLIRYVTLCFYMIMSPLMFLGWVFPQMEGVASKYWKGFLGRAFFAPIYLLLVYFGTTIVNNFFGGGTGGSAQATDFRNTFNGDPTAINNSFESTIPPFIISCIFLIAAVVVANKLGADGASTMLKIGSNIRNGAEARLKRGAIATARTTGKAAAFLPAYGARRASNYAGGQLERGLNRLQRSQSKTVRNVFGSVLADDVIRGKAKNMKNAKYGLSDTVAEIQKKRSVIDTRFTDGEKVRLGLEAQKRKEAAQMAIHPDTGKEVLRSSLTPDQLQKVEATERANGTGAEILHPVTGKYVKRSSLSQADLATAESNQEKAIAEMQQTVAGLSATQLEEMMNQQPDQFKQVIGNMKASQADKLMESDGLTQDQKDTLKKGRQDAILASLTSNGKDFNEEITKLSTKQLETLGDDFVRENAARFTKKQMDDLQKSDAFTEGQKINQLTSRSNAQAALVNSNNQNEVNSLFQFTKTENGQTKTSNRKPIEIAQLSRDVLLSDNALPHITGNVLEEIYRNQTLSADDREVLKRKILSTGNIPAMDSAKNYLKTAHGRLNWNNPEPIPTPPSPPPTPDPVILDQNGQPFRRNS